MFRWIKEFGLEDLIIFIRNHTEENSIYLPEWFLYSFPDALFLFSGVLFIDIIWDEERSKGKYLWILSFLTIVIGSEISQALQVVPGTFDWYDLTLMIFAGFNAYFISIYLQQKERKTIL